MPVQSAVPRTSSPRALQLGAPTAGVTLAPRPQAVRNGRRAAYAFAPSPSFGRMFEQLPPFADGCANSAGLRNALLAIGAPGGALDANDDLYGPDGGPIKLLTALPRSAAKDNPHDTAGTTFFGQFIDHDLSFDATARAAADPVRSPNARTARFDLDCVYGLGPIAQPELYDPMHPMKLLLGSGGRFEDLPRRSDKSPVVADVRNDANLMIAGLHAAFCKFHNNAVDLVSRPAKHPLDVFAAARKLTTWHYQWLVVNRILPTFVGPDLVEDVLCRGARFFRPYAAPYLPVEFSGAAYRFADSTVRPSYRANLAGDGGRPFCGLIFDPRGTATSGSDPSDLRGGFRSPRRFIDWQSFFDFGGTYSADVRPNKAIDTVLSTPLFALPDGPTVVPQRTLLRQLTWALPSGQSVAREMEVDVLSAADLADFGAYGHDLDRSTPLWLYVLREAQLVNDGRFLGPVGGRIVAEVMIGLLRAHPDSYLFTRPSFRPMLGARVDSEYEIADFLRFAQVDPDSRRQ